MPKLNLLADIDGHIVYPGDEITLTEFIPGLGEEITTTGKIREEQGKFYLGDRELWLLDTFKLTNSNGRHGLQCTDHT